jgi:hypothetical protein
VIPDDWWLSPVPEPDINESPQLSLYDRQGPPVFGQGLFPSEATLVEERAIEISARQLARKISFYAMCFGEGPRFNKTGIDQAVREIMAETTLSPVLGSRMMVL